MRTEDSRRYERTIPEVTLDPGLKCQGFQVRQGQKRSWRYRLDPGNLDRMKRYAEQRAREKGLRRLSRVSEKLYTRCCGTPPGIVQ